MVVAAGHDAGHAVVLVIARSADSVIVSVSVAVLLPGVGSVTPAGAVTVATLVMLPVARAGHAGVDGERDAAAGRQCRHDDAGALHQRDRRVGHRRTRGAAGGAAAGDAGDVQVGDGRVLEDRAVGVRRAGVADDDRVRRRAAGIDAGHAVGLGDDRSACGVSVSVSVAVLLAGSVSITVPGTTTVTVLVIVPVALGAIAAVTV